MNIRAIGTLFAFLAAFFATTAVCLAAAPSPRGAPPSPGPGKGVSTEMRTRELPAEPVAVKPLAPGEAPGASSADLSAAQQSQIGAGFKVRLGHGKKKAAPQPPEEKPADEESGGK